ncbi:Hpt domain-containing protein [Sphingomonas jatrophae]|uniref:HPt (Histidine-containing phosphotransfer) domain-containing protein n=1 Tax=Sphingomonas jatrophae TaxID=1166337 RepID=A0A1I6LLJ9_9SPHN|nr:Hpt domain-containing protein [Sphingomonas jatrophae]SFS04355.1 HPt (histidine-containing phosphotransfer) domain-containing protein [Sphingomonas jatrophae]
MQSEAIVDWPAFARARAQLGAEFVRIVGYFREDGAKSVRAIEAAMRANDPVALVMPAHTLKGEAAQFGAMPLSMLAELIEMTARRCIETHDGPNELIEDVVRLRPLFEATMALFDRELNPLRTRAGGFGRRVA